MQFAKPRGFSQSHKKNLLWKNDNYTWRSTVYPVVLNLSPVWSNLMGFIPHGFNHHQNYACWTEKNKKMLSLSFKFQSSAGILYKMLNI